jgi:hypothetical protein
VAQQCTTACIDCDNAHGKSPADLRGLTIGKGI